MNQMTDWSKDVPPSEGWWNASTERNEDTRRYWHPAVGSVRGWWSVPVYVGDPDERCERAKNHPAESQEGIEWRGLTERRTA